MASRLSAERDLKRHYRKYFGEDPILLTCYETDRRLQILRGLGVAGFKTAHIIYDLIPVLQPEFTSARHRTEIENMFRFVLEHNALGICISNATLDDLLRWNENEVKAIGYNAGRVAQLASLVDTSGPANKPFDKLINKPFAMYVSRIAIRKNHSFLVDVWGQVAKVVGIEKMPHLLLIGKPQGGEKKISEAIERNPLIRDLVHVETSVSDEQLRWAYRNARFCLFPSSAEGWGLGASEALAYGLPILHSDVPAINEAAQGVMPSLPVEDLDAWSDAVAKVISEPKYYNELKRMISKKYRPRSMEDFSSDVFKHIGKSA